ncbi:TauD/TfdA dioxygenase family protein [Billgrantia endophytica]|uniref:TauD/TfdA family dioxygenase n=1 Tax=Billgrantia endophytica TaxID=2033802 RepID=A0A2N7UE25_9GAMM|nr:TauD/TfdA family dioxygenase [Halomonas endophytica]PMR78716.1 TauD/TfdA family dioxygenase [Halomonas endophytica]
MSMKLRKVSPNVGVEVTGVDLNESLSEIDYVRLVSILENTGLLIVRNQDISPRSLIDFTRYFGKACAYTRSKFELEDYPEILVLSNIKKDGKGIGSPVSGRAWHIDGHYLDEFPRATILAMKILQKEGGNTHFANIQAAWSSLPEEVANRVKTLKATISRVKSREYNYPERGPATPEEVEEWEDVIHPVLIRHPVTGRAGLGVGGNVPWDIHGIDDVSALSLMTFLQEWTIRPEFTYEHVWREGDVIAWDNWTVMHKASPYSGERLLFRTTAF